MRVKVYRSELGDWESWCPQHQDGVITHDWTSAMETAWGHVAMHHHRRRNGSA